MSIIERALERLGHGEFAKSLEVEVVEKQGVNSQGNINIELATDLESTEARPDQIENRIIQELPIQNKSSVSERVRDKSVISPQKMREDSKDEMTVKVGDASLKSTSHSRPESTRPQFSDDNPALSENEVAAKKAQETESPTPVIGYTLSSKLGDSDYVARKSRSKAVAAQSLFYGKKKQKGAFDKFFSFSIRRGAISEGAGSSIGLVSGKTQKSMRDNTEHDEESEVDKENTNITASAGISTQSLYKNIALGRMLKTQIIKMITAAGKDTAKTDQSHSSANRLIWGGSLVLLFGFGGLGTWAAMAPLKSAAVAPGVVKVSGERKTVQHLEGGIIKEILISEGERVAAGQVLLRLDDAQVRAAVQLLEGQHDALVAQVSRLVAERDGAKEITFPEQLTRRANDPQVFSVLAGEQKLFETRYEAINGQINVLKQRIKEYNDEIVGLKAQERSARKQLVTIQEELDSAKTIYEQGIYAKPRYLALQRGLARLEGEIGEHVATIAQTRQKIGETELRIIDAKNQQLHKISQEIQAAQSSMFDMDERLNAATDRLSRIEIRAPSAGTIVAMKFHTVGGVIPQGAYILDIVPSDAKLIIESRLNPRDIDVVHPGSEAQVQLTAYGMRNTPTLPGEVVYVSADRFTDQRNGLAYYLARIEIAPETLVAFPDITLQPGMPADVQIVIGERTALEYMFKPLKDSFNNAFLEE